MRTQTERLIDEIKCDPNRTAIDIAQAVRCTRQFATKIARQIGVTLPKAPLGPRRLEDTPPGPIHQRVGARICQWRMVFNDYSVSEAAIVLGWSRLKMRQAEAGVLNFTLVDLEQLAEALDTTVVDLINPQLVNWRQ